MSYQALIDTNLNRAFNLLKDLAVEVTLTKKPNPSFNFGSGSAEFNADITVITKAIVIEKEKKSKERNTVETQVMLKSKEIGDLTRYATLQLNSQTWNIGDIPKNDGFISIVSVYREV